MEITLSQEQKTELASSISELVANAIDQAKREAGLTTRRLNQKNAMKYSGIVTSYTGWKSMFIDKGLTEHRYGNKVFYYKDEIDAFIASHEDLS